ncbi:DNA-3-methyladenine glycosylase I [Fibrobacterota bacterium]
MTEKKRCGWCLQDKLYRDYHDKVWGYPVHDDRKLFEMLLLDGAQAGLSWHTILMKQDNYRKAFDNFNAEKMICYKQAKIEKLMQNSGIIRNRLKIQAFITNAGIFLDLKKEFGSFDKYIWQFTDHKTIINNPRTLRDIPVTSAESDAMSKDLKKRGFKFAGSTICYAYMQSIGMVDDHLVDCWRKRSVKKLK